jgi:threonine/homoserine/homoserine lactone efflux protein
MSVDNIIVLLLAVASISFKPGPGMAAIVARAIENGFLSSFLVSMGAITVELIYFTLAYFSFSFIENYFGSLVIILKVVGAVYIFYLAFEAFKKSKLIPESGAPVIQQSYLKDYMTGITVTLSNPLVILFYTALIPTVLDLSKINIQGLLVALSIIFAVHFVILTTQSALATQVRILLQDKVTIQKLNLTSAILLCGVGLYILYSLIKQF